MIGTVIWFWLGVLASLTLWVGRLSTMLSTQLLQDYMSGATYINMVTYSMSLMGLGVTPSAVDCSMPALLGEGDTDSD